MSIMVNVSCATMSKATCSALFTGTLWKKNQSGYDIIGHQCACLIDDSFPRRTRPHGPDVFNHATALSGVDY